MATTQYDYIGKGKFWIRRLGVSNAPMVRLGNTIKGTLKVDEDKKELKDYESTGGGNRNTLSRIKAVSIEIQTSNLSPDNQAIGVRGAVSALTSLTAIPGEAHTAIVGSLVTTHRLPNRAQSMTVKTADDQTTYDEDVDYERTVSGIYIIPGGEIVDASQIKIGYTPLAESVLEALVQSGEEYALIFEGENEAQEDLPDVTEVYRVKFSPSGSDLIGDDFGTLTLVGDVLKDETKIGTGISKFFRRRSAQLAA